MKILTTHDMPGGWQNEFIGKDQNVLFFPDANANYWLYKMERKFANKDIGLRVKGLYAHSRYMSINVYDDTKFTPIACISDVDIQPDEGKINIFSSLEEEFTGDDSYSVDVVPEGAKFIGENNVVRYKDEIERVSIILRYYGPQGDEYGSVPLPKIEAFNVKTGEEVELPKEEIESLKPMRKKIREGVRDSLVKNVMRPVFLLNRDGELKSYHFSGNVMYPNKDNNYLVIPMKIEDDQVAIIKFKAPEIRKAGGNSGDVRYFSMGQGDRESHNMITMSDVEMNVREDGFIYMAISKDKTLSEKCEGDNFMPLLIDKKTILIYRNLMAEEGYEGNMEKVPVFREARRESAEKFIGEYAPIGKIIKKEEFLKVGFDLIK